MDVRGVERVFFIGVGGIGMSALARFFRANGAIVSGYDKTETALTRRLIKDGISVQYTDDVALCDKDAALVVYTPAIPSDCVVLQWYRDNGYKVFKRSDVLMWITESMFAITVAGTHGKTTISTTIAYLLRKTGYGCNAFLGGISVNYDSNYWSSENNTAVIEADEYDRSFLKLFPDIALLTSTDADHLDIYGTHAEVEAAFIKYTKNIKAGGALLAKHGLHRLAEMDGQRTVTYSLQNDAADIFAENIMQDNGGYVFDVIGRDWKIENVKLYIGGMHNVENTVAAIAVTQMLGVSGDAVRDALAEFRGVRRRFEYHVKTDKVVYIDDYAHHPEELASLIKSAKLLFPKRKCVIAFQPHLFSRTRDLATEFARSLDLADEVILLDIYPAREKPIEGVSAKSISEKMANPAVTILSKDGLIEYVKIAPVSLFITAGAGDIDKLVEPIKEILEKK